MHLYIWVQVRRLFLQPGTARLVRAGGKKHSGTRGSRDDPGTTPARPDGLSPCGLGPTPQRAFARCACSGGTGEGLSPTHTRDTMPPFIKEQSVFAAPPQ